MTPVELQLPFVDIHDTHLQLTDIYVDGHWRVDDLCTRIPQEKKDNILNLATTLVIGVVANSRDTTNWFFLTT